MLDTEKKNENNEQVVNNEQENKQAENQEQSSEETLEKEVINKVHEQLKSEKKIEVKPEEAEKINEAIKRGFTTAKNQLHADISKAKDKVKSLETEKAELLKQLNELKANKEQKEDTSNPKIEELTAKLKVMEDTAVEAVKKVETLETSLKLKELEAYKNSLIADAKGEIIAGMVTGNTPEEIKASVENAKAEYKRIVNAERKNLNIPSREEEQKAGEQKEIEIPNVNVKNAKQLEREWESEKERIKTEIYRQHGFNI